MSFNIRNVRQISDDPSTKFANDLAKKVSKFLASQQLDKLENKEDIYSNAQDVGTVIKFHTLNSTKYFDGSIIYYPTFEPDYDKLELWLRGKNTGNELPDLSELGRVTNVVGDPILIDGTPLDMGIYTGGTKSYALTFNRPNSEFENEEYLVVDASAISSLGVTSFSTGKSYFIRVRMKDLATQGGKDRRLFEKTDDSTPNNGIQVRVKSDGKVWVLLKKGGTEYKNETAAGTIVVNNVYDIVITFTVSGSVMHVYVNGVDKTLTTASDTTNWHAQLSDQDMYLFARGPTDTDGHSYADFYDFRVYDEKVLTSNSVGNSAQFAAGSNRIDLGTRTSLWSQSLTKWSISFWLKLNSTTNATLGGSGAWGVTNGSKLLWIFNNTIGVGIWQGNEIDAWRSVTLDTTTWHHCVATYDSTLGSANLKFYYDKVLGGTTGNATTTTNPNDTFMLGWTSGSFSGHMRDFRFWKSKALTQTEVNNVYDNIGTAPYPDYWLQLTEGVVGSDVVGETLTGTVTGATFVTNEVGNLYNNKWTINYIPTGSLPMVSDYFASY